jgi:hypothetical protein
VDFSAECIWRNLPSAGRTPHRAGPTSQTPYQILVLTTASIPAGLPPTAWAARRRHYRPPRRAPSSGRRHTNRALSSTSPCICYSFPSHPFACPGCELAEAGGTAAGAGRRRWTPSPAAPPPRPNPQTDAWWAPSRPPPFPRPISALEHRNLGRRRRQPCPRTQLQTTSSF